VREEIKSEFRERLKALEDYVYIPCNLYSACKSADILSVSATLHG